MPYVTDKAVNLTRDFGVEMSDNMELELVSLTKRYGATVAVNAISYHFSAGTYACLLGPSGCGKSSTLRMIAGC